LITNVLIEKGLSMKKFIPLLLCGAMTLGAIGCENAAKTSADAPGSTSASPMAPDAKSAQQTKNDATSDVRKAQVESDIRAREQRNDMTGGDTSRSNKDLQSEVRGKLEANIPASQLIVDAKDGAVTISGTVPAQAQLGKIEPLAKQIKGVKSVVNKVTFAPAKPN
jgi:hyperosmotically inducible periplasmic protein